MTLIGRICDTRDGRNVDIVVTGSNGKPFIVTLRADDEFPPDAVGCEIAIETGGERPPRD